MGTLGRGTMRMHEMLRMKNAGKERAKERGGGRKGKSVSSELCVTFSLWPGSDRILK